MSKFDAHAHFFQPGFAEVYGETTRRRDPDEVTVYAALAAQHDITGVLAVAYEGMPWAADNNAYVAALAQRHPWIHPLAYCHRPADLAIAALEGLQAHGFVGIVLYLFDPVDLAQLAGVPAQVWQWLEARRWPISVNGTTPCWRAWQPILAVHPGLVLLASHLGLPPAASPTLDVAGARQNLAVLPLHTAPNVYVKLSGFYALASPTHAYPHRDAWIYVEQVTQAFGVDRLLWGSDFSPVLEHVSFAQSVDVLEHMPYFSPTERAALYGDNLARLLGASETRRT